VAKYYYKDNKRKAFKFLESSLSAHKSEGTSTLTFLLGIVLALVLVLAFFCITPRRPEYHNLNDVKEIYPIFRFSLAFIFTL